MLNGPSWPETVLESDRSNPESVQTVPNSARNRSYCVGGGYGPVQNINLLNHNRSRLLTC